MNIQFLLEHPAVQAAVLPFVVALVIGVLLRRTPLAWLAIVAGWALMVAVSGGFSFVPLTASRKIQLAVLVAPLIGLLLDRWRNPPVRAAWMIVPATALLTLWSMSSVLAQRAPWDAALTGLGLALVAIAVTVLVLRLRDDGVAAGAAGVGLGVAVGIAALLSASIGFFAAGTAVAASAGALLAVQFLLGHAIAPGLIGTVTLAWSSVLFASGTLMLAQLPWLALLSLPLVPIAAALPLERIRSLRIRLVCRVLLAVAAAALPIAIAWFATRGDGAA